MKKFATLFFILLSVSLINAQKVKFKKGDVLIDGVKILKYDVDGNNYSLLTQEDDEILFMKFIDNNTEYYRGDDYLKLNFVEFEIIVETTDIDWIYEVGTKRSHLKKILKLILKEKVINKNGVINKERLEKFHTKYDEKVTERTIRN